MTSLPVDTRNLTPSLQTGIFTLTYSGILIQVNTAGALLLGSDRSNLLNRHFHEFIKPDSIIRWDLFFRQVIADEEGISDFFPFLGKGGEDLSCMVQAVKTGRDDSTGLISLVIQKIPGDGIAYGDQSVFGKILDESLNEIYLFDAETLQFIEVNKGARTNLGYTLEELRLMTPLDLKPECTRDRFLTLIRILINGEEDRILFSTIHERKDGTTYPVEVHLQKLQVGERKAILAVILDITEQKQIEADLHESERKYQNLYKYAQVGLFETSLKNATVVACNQRYVDLIGFPSINEAIGKDVLAAYVHPEDRDEVARILREQGHIDDHIVRFTNLTTKVPFWAQFSARYNYERDVAEGSIIDISPLKETGEALRRSEEKYRLVVESVNEPIVVAQDGRLQMANPSMVRLLGYPISELLNRPFTEFIHPDDRAMVLSRHYSRMDGEDVPQHYPFRVVTAEGVIKWIENHSVRFEWSGRPATLNLFNDITRQRQNEEALRIQYSLGLALAGCHSLQDVVKAVLDTVMQLEGINSTALSLIDPENGTIDYSDKRGSDISLSECQNFGSGLCRADQATTGRPYYGPATGCDGQCCPSQPSGNRMFASLPILERDMVIAILNASGRSGSEIPGITRRQLETMTTQIRGVIMRVRSEQRLAEREKQYRILAENSTDVIWTLDLTGKFTYISPSVCQLRGYTPSEVMNQKPEEVISSESLVVANEKMNRQIEQLSRGIIPPPDLTEVKQPRKDGTAVWTEVVSKALCDDEGRPIGFIGVSRDISERKRIQEALREREELFRIMFENVPAGIILVDAETRIIREANRNALFLSGRDRNDVIGHICTSTICPDMQACCQEPEQGNPAEYSEQVILHADGRKIPVIKSVNRVILSDTPYFLESFFDISDLKKTQEALQEANHKLRLLTGITRHDIFNQLNAISLLLDLAMTTYDQDKSSEYIRSAKLASGRIDAITAFTREFEGFGTISPGWYRISSLINAAISEIPFQEAKIENNIADTLEVYTEPIIRKVFTTLMENAIRHGETITTIRFSAYEDKKDLLIICEDDGIGIPESDKTEIFKQGFGKNTGVGLFLAREILSITGLSICETGSEGKGARFEIRVPDTKFRRTSGE